MPCSGSERPPEALPGQSGVSRRLCREPLWRADAALGLGGQRPAEQMGGGAAACFRQHLLRNQLSSRLEETHGSCSEGSRGPGSPAAPGPEPSMDERGYLSRALRGPQLTWHA